MISYPVRLPYEQEKSRCLAGAHASRRSGGPRRAVAQIGVCIYIYIYCITVFTICVRTDILQGQEGHRLAKMKASHGQ